MNQGKSDTEDDEGICGAGGSRRGVKGRGKRWVRDDRFRACVSRG